MGGLIFLFVGGSSGEGVTWSFVCGGLVLGAIFIVVPSLHRRLGAIYTCIQGLQLLDLDCHNEITVSCHELQVFEG